MRSSGHGRPLTLLAQLVRTRSTRHGLARAMLMVIGRVASHAVSVGRQRPGGGTYRDALFKQAGTKKPGVQQPHCGTAVTQLSVAKKPPADDVACYTATLATLSQDDGEVGATVEARLENAKAAKKAALSPQTAWRAAQPIMDKLDRKFDRLDAQVPKRSEKRAAAKAELATARVGQAAAAAELEAVWDTCVSHMMARVRKPLARL